MQGAVIPKSILKIVNVLAPFGSRNESCLRIVFGGDFRPRFYCRPIRVVVEQSFNHDLLFANSITHCLRRVTGLIFSILINRATGGGAIFRNEMHTDIRRRPPAHRHPTLNAGLDWNPAIP